MKKMKEYKKKMKKKHLINIVHQYNNIILFFSIFIEKNKINNKNRKKKNQEINFKKNRKNQKNQIENQKKKESKY